MMDILGFFLIGAVLFAIVAQVGGLEKEPVRIREAKAKLDRDGYHLL